MDENTLSEAVRTIVEADEEVVSSLHPLVRETVQAVRERWRELEGDF